MALFVPDRHEPPGGNGRSLVERREVDLGGRIALAWLSYRGTVPLDPGRLTEFHVHEVPSRTGTWAGRSVLTVRIDLGLVEQHVVTLSGRPPRTPIRFQTGRHAVRPSSRRWLTKIGELVAGLERDPELVDEPWFRAEVEGWWIVAGLLYVQPHNNRDLLPTPTEAAGSPLAVVTKAASCEGISLGTLLSRRRRDLGLSQSKLAQLLADVSGTPTITRERVSDYERERHIPDGWLEYLSIVLDVPLDELERAAQVARARRYRP